MTAQESELLKQLADVLNDNNWEKSDFTPPQYQLILKLLTWPPKQVFPVLDIVRVLILHPRAAAYYIDHYVATNTQGNNHNLFSLLLKIGSSPQCLSASRMLSLKFIANMFSRDSLVQIIKQSQDRILDVLSTMSSDLTVSKFLANVLLNFSQLLMKQKDPESSSRKIKCANILLNILRKKVDETVVYTLFVALGTLIYYDKTFRRSLLSLGLQPIVHLFIQSENTKLREVSADIVKLTYNNS